MKILILLLTFLVITAGCTSMPKSPESFTATPDIMPRLAPSPTPSDSTLPLTCQVTDLKVYINEMDGFCFAYPMRFTTGEQSSDKLVIQGPAVDDSYEPIHATLTIEMEPASTDKPLREQAVKYLKDFSVLDPETFTWSKVTVGGETGWMVEPVPVMLSYRIVFLQHNGSIYRLLFWPVDIPDAQADLNDLTQTTLGSFAFMK
jgi:hypothetical protein